MPQRLTAFRILELLRCLAGVPGLQGRFCWWLRHSLHGFLRTWRIAWKITCVACARGCLWHFQDAFVAPKIPNLDRPERSNLSSPKSTNSLSKSRSFILRQTKIILVILENFLSTVNCNRNLQVLFVQPNLPRVQRVERLPFFLANRQSVYIYAFMHVFVYISTILMYNRHLKHFKTSKSIANCKM